MKYRKNIKSSQYLYSVNLIQYEKVIALTVVFQSLIGALLIVVDYFF